MSKVFLLGAGFSRAVSEEHMPLMTGLDAGVRGELDARARATPGAAGLPRAVGQFGGDFEAWLSYLAVDQPWLPAADNLRNRAAFLDVSGAVGEVLRVAQCHATSDQDMPEWLGQLARYWLRTESTVVTFNYDLLAEYAVLHTWERPNSGVETLYRVPLTLSTARSGYALVAGDDRRAFDLLKLHGSLNWWYSGPDAPVGDTVYLEPTYDAWARSEPYGYSVEQDDAALYAETRERVDLVDKVPLIVPPASAKSAYYANLGLRAQWAAAAAALARADELVVMGYSLPATDELARALLLTGLHPEATVHSVDLGTDPCDRLVAMFGEERVIPTLAGQEHAVEEYVEHYCQDPDEG